MVDRDVLSARLNSLEDYLAELRPFAEWSEDAFVAEPGLHHLAERFLHLACEAVADAAHHVIADLGLRQPTSYRDAIVVLADEGFLSPELAGRLQDWMGFRNVLVHLYLQIDHRRAFRAIRDELGDLESFAGAMARFLESPPDAAKE